MEKNILSEFNTSVLEHNMCCGCAACNNICPVNAVVMVQDELGFLCPTINNERCLNCGNCVKVCPAIGIDKTNDSQELEMIAGYSLDEQLVFNSSSGGFFGILVDYFLKEGVICGVAWNKDFSGTHHVIINDPNDKQLIRSSKYVQSNKGTIYKKISSLLKEGKKVLYSGCPCEVVALKNYLPKNLLENLYTVDLVCQGPTSAQAIKEYNMYLENKYGSKISAINMRFPIGNWIPQYLKVSFDNGKVFLDRLYDTALGDAVRVMQRDACYKCQYAGSYRKSDLTLGDYHGVDKQSKVYHASGVSIASAHTQKGVELLNIIKNSNVVYEKCNYQDIAKHNHRIEGPWNPLPERKQFVDCFKKKGLFFASNAIISSKRKIFRKMPITIRLLIQKVLK